MKFDGHHQFEKVSAQSDPPIGILKNPRLVSRVSKAVAEVVGDHARQGQLPVTIGGDHSLVSFDGASRNIVTHSCIGYGNHIWYFEVKKPVKIMFALE